MKRNSVRGLILLFVAVQLAWLLKPKVGSRPPHTLILKAAQASQNLSPEEATAQMAKAQKEAALDEQRQQELKVLWVGALGVAELIALGYCWTRSE